VEALDGDPLADQKSAAFEQLEQEPVPVGGHREHRRELGAENTLTSPSSPSPRRSSRWGSASPCEGLCRIRPIAGATICAQAEMQESGSGPQPVATATPNAAGNFSSRRGRTGACWSAIATTPSSLLLLRGRGRTGILRRTADPTSRHARRFSRVVAARAPGRRRNGH
jgi:hypothetical protein